jgi:hypothetical protein
MKEIQLELDRFEDNAKAVCYDSEGIEHVLPESWIPTGVKEGDEFKLIIQTID